MEEEKGDQKEDFDMGIKIDLQFVDAARYSNCYCSPFEIAEEMVEPVLMEVDQNDGEETSVIGETVKRMMYERKFSASLYAFNGIPECLRLKQSAGEANYETERSQQYLSDCKTNEEKKDTEEETFQKVVQDEEVEIPCKQTSTELIGSSSSSSSFLSTESSSEQCLWSSLNLSSICSNI